MDAREASVWKGLVAGMAGGLAGSAVIGLLQSMRADKPKLSQKIHRDLSHLGQPPGRRHVRMASHPAVLETMKQPPPEVAAESSVEEPAAVALAEAVSQKVLHRHPTENELKVSAPAIQYALGAAIGAAYGMAAEFAPVTAVAQGSLMGTGVAIAKEEIIKPALGLSKNPLQQPVSAHAWEMWTHLVFGVTCDSVRRLVRAML